MIDFMKIFIIFIVCSVGGWIVELIMTYLRSRKIVNRGFLIGPCCPIYGIGFLIVFLVLRRFMNEPIALFFLIIMVCTVVEYLASLKMEKLFNARWWDYRKRVLNIDGRVCLPNSLGFGLLGMLGLYYIYPFMIKFLNNFSNGVITLLFWILMIIFMIDVCISLNIMNKIKKNISFIRRDNTGEIKKKINEMMTGSALMRRIKNAFPNFRPVRIKLNRNK